MEGCVWRNNKSSEALPTCPKSTLPYSALVMVESFWWALFGCKHYLFRFSSFFHNMLLTFSFCWEKGRLRNWGQCKSKKTRLRRRNNLGRSSCFDWTIMYDKDKHTNIPFSLSSSLCNSFVPKRLDVNGMQKWKLQIPLMLWIGCFFYAAEAPPHPSIIFP